MDKYDRLLTWNQPPKLSWWLPQPLPDSIPVRVLRVCVPIPGSRTRVLFPATTLRDPQRFPTDALAELYRRRWQVELFFQDIKTVLHLDVLRCLSPDMIRCELHMHLIPYNLIRAVMLEAALLHATDLHRLSFKGTAESLRLSECDPEASCFSLRQGSASSRLGEWTANVVSCMERLSLSIRQGGSGRAAATTNWRGTSQLEQEGLSRDIRLPLVRNLFLALSVMKFYAFPWPSTSPGRIPYH
ncbi:MAG: transposase [Acidobacteriia bacterium]|nr:transposase [Terriglobia bacterium]